MKKNELIFSIIVFAPLMALADPPRLPVKSDTLKNKKTFAADSRVVTFLQLDQRKIYHWANGERSTPTGRQAGERTSGFVRVYGDSAVVVPDPFKKKTF
jgi:hypothetical protein